MPRFTLHTLDTAPEASRETMAALARKFGFLPNLIREMAEAPSTVKGYATLGRLVEASSLSPVEQQIVLAAVSFANTCEYCVAAHSAGLTQAGLPHPELEALREGRPFLDAKLEALRTLTIEIVDTRGRPRPAPVDAFRKAGYGNRQVLEVILVVGMKTISNYVNHIAETPLDPELRGFAWSADARTGAAAGR